MSFTLDPSSEHAALAEGVHRAMYADSLMLRAKASMWKFGGIGLMLLLGGAGAGAAFYGYSYVHDATNTADKLAAAIGKALEKVKVDGEVKLASDQKVGIESKEPLKLEGTTVKVDPDSTIGLNVPTNATVKIDPNSKVGVSGTVNLDPNAKVAFPRPTPDQLRPDQTVNNANAKVVTNFTVFKSVNYGKGEVHTGWKFDSSEQTVPSGQYCYYAEVVESGLDLKIDLATDGRINQNIQRRGKFDALDAARQCVWYNGMPTVMSQNEPVPPLVPDVASNDKAVVDGSCGVACGKLGKGKMY